MSVGAVGEGATVLQGQNLALLNITVKLDDVRSVEDARELIAGIRSKVGPAFGSPLRRLEPLVLVNRQAELTMFGRQLASSASILIVEGVAGVGKSSFVRAALEFRDPDVPIIWLPAEAMTAPRILQSIAGALGLVLEVEDVLATAAAAFSAARPTVLVLDGAEALLDDGGHWATEDLRRLFDLVASTEHAIKVLLTTRRRPLDLTAAREVVWTMRLQGLSDAAAIALLRIRAPHDETVDQAMRLQLLRHLTGNPKLIELLAASLDDLPLSVVARNLQQAANIADYVAREVLATLNADERAVTVTASLLSGAFPLDDLLELHVARAGTADVIAAVRGLVHRAVLEKSDEGTYYLHPLVAEAAEPEPTVAAAGHAVAARWLEGRAATDSGPLAEALRHLARALQLAPSPELCDHAVRFFDEHHRTLSYGGDGRALIRLIDLMLTTDMAADRVYVLKFARATELWQLDDHADAHIAFAELWDRLLAEHEAQDVGEGADASLMHMLVLVGNKLGNVLLELDRLAEADRVADRLESLNLDDSDIQVMLRFAELRFDIVRKQADGQAMLHWARIRFELAHAWHDAGPSPQRLDAIAEAHFALGVGYMSVGSFRSCLRNFLAQLRAKLDIGKLGGVAAGLHNLGRVLQPVDADLSTLMLATTEAIRDVIGFTRDAERDEIEAVAALVADPDRLSAAMDTLGGIDRRLLPHAERALDQTRQLTAPSADHGSDRAGA